MRIRFEMRATGDHRYELRDWPSVPREGDSIELAPGDPGTLGGLCLRVDSVGWMEDKDGLLAVLRLR